MWRTPFFILTACALSLLQICFFSQLPFPFSAFSFPVLGIAYGVLRDRPLLAAGWALLGGYFLDLHGMLGFGAELGALFASFLAVRFLFQRLVTNAGLGALFLLGALSALVHWIVLVAFDGVRVIFGGVPIMTEPSLFSLLLPLRQSLVAGAGLCLLISLENAARRRFRNAFISSHVIQSFS